MQGQRRGSRRDSEEAGGLGGSRDLPKVPAYDRINIEKEWKDELSGKTHFEVERWCNSQERPHSRVAAIISNVNVTVNGIRRLQNDGEPTARYIEDGILALGLEWVGGESASSHRLPSLWTRRASEKGAEDQRAIEKMWAREWAAIKDCESPVTEIKLAWNVNGNHWHDITMDSKTRTVSVYDPMGTVWPSQLDKAMRVVRDIVKLWCRMTGVQGEWTCTSSPGGQQARGDGVNCGIHVILHEAQQSGFDGELIAALHKTPGVVRRWLAKRAAQEVEVQRSVVLQPLEVDSRDLELSKHGIELIESRVKNPERLSKSSLCDLQSALRAEKSRDTSPEGRSRPKRAGTKKKVKAGSKRTEGTPGSGQALQGGSVFSVKSLNVGPRGFWQSQRTLQRILQQDPSTAILHLQDTKVRERQVKQMRKALQTIAPDFVAFHSCPVETAKRNRKYPVSVTTLIRRSLAADTCQHKVFTEGEVGPHKSQKDKAKKRFERLVKLDAEMWAREHGPDVGDDEEGQSKGQDNGCMGRILAVRCSPSDAASACYHVNVYMPAGPDNMTWRKIAKEIIRIGDIARQEGAFMVVCGDFNANIVLDGRKGYSEMESSSKTILRRDKLLARLVKNSNLQVGVHLNSKGMRTHTWSRWEKAAILDYCLFSRDVVPVSGKASRVKRDPIIDHKIISTLFPASQLGQVRPVQEREQKPPRVRWSNLPKYSQEFKQMTSREEFLASPDEDKVMAVRRWGCWAVDKAASVCGVTKPTMGHRHFCLPGHKKLFRTMTLLGRWRRIEVSKASGPLDPSVPTRKQLRAKYKRVSGTDIDLGELEDKDDAGSRDSVVGLLKEKMQLIRQKIRQDEKEASTISLERCKKAIRRGFDEGRIKYITGKREPAQPLWGTRPSGPIGIRLRGNRSDRARAHVLLQDSGVDMIWSRKGKIGRTVVLGEVWMCVMTLADQCDFDVIKGDSIPTVLTDGPNKLECQRAHLAKEGVNSRRACIECEGKDIWTVPGHGLDTMLCVTCRMMVTTRVEPTPFLLSYGLSQRSRKVTMFP